MVDCTDVGHGDQALVYLGRYLYRGVLPEKNIIADTAGEVSFRYKDNRGLEHIRTMPGGEFLWLLLRHVLPRRFRRVRDYGLLHTNCKRLVQLLQLVLRVPVPSPRINLQRSPVLCQSCEKAMTLIARMLRITEHQLC
ncbi:transposase [Synechococcus sp. CS-602]|nr:transposase [Synechococcus sp. CS-602]MCT0245279.1 transposase [Synechococcus sp. CS-601]TWB90657.1 putative transposase [Synechococcus sp. Ace-Pa]